MNIGIGIGLAYQTGGGEPFVPSLGALQIDTFPVLIDTFEIVFA